MFAAKHYPDSLSPEELDLYLARGWYRMGQSIFTTHFLCFGEEFYSALWIRQDLRGYTFRKSLRKILRKNDRAFEVRIGPGLINRDKEELYQIYRQDFPGVIAPSLQDTLLDGGHRNIYHTYEVAIYDQGQLIGLSYFDLGRKSAASIIGIYHPEYRKHSLGIYTMLKEMEYCMERDFHYYYPGYVVPGYARFDYKARIGAVDYYDLHARQWLPFTDLNPDTVPLYQIRNKLTELHQLAAKTGLDTQLQYYPLFEANLFGYWHKPFFDFPVLLQCDLGRVEEGYYLVVFDPRTQLYRLLFCSPYEEAQFYFSESYANTFEHPRYFLELLYIEEVLEASPAPGLIIHALQRERENITEY